MYFSTKLLCKGKSTKESTLIPYEGELKADKPFLPENSEDVLVAGGFPSLCAESSMILSPTLQLNSDMTTLNARELKAIAEAELFRAHKADFRTYIVDSDPRICVISSEPEQLERFVDTYGGILEIEPLLLKGKSEDFRTVLDLQVSSVEKGYKLNYSIRSPVNEDLCTYCGSCGPACPKQCISPELKIDFTQCDFCRECEKVCSHKAIDVYGVGEAVMHIPALLILGETTIEMPEDSRGIYTESSLTDFFQSLFSSEVKEVVCHNNTICQYSGRLGIGCSRCVVSCAHGAVQKNEKGITIDHLLCEECGNCMSVCPTGAMQNGHFRDSTFVEYCDQLKSIDAQHIIIGEEKDLLDLWWRSKKKRAEETFFLEYQNVNSLTPFTLIFLFGSGASNITVLSGSEHHEALRKCVESTHNVVTSLFDSGSVMLKDPGEFDLLSAEKNHHPLLRYYGDFSFTNRRAKQSDIYHFLLQAAGKSVTLPKDTGFVRLVCDTAKCTHCLACVNDCGMEALQPEDENLSLNYMAGLCVGCNVCVMVCPENALSMTGISDVSADYFNKRLLAQAEPAVCRECGKVYGTRKSLERVLSILSAKESFNKDHFELCSDCRVIKIFETEETR